MDNSPRADEAAYDRRRTDQWLAGQARGTGLSRRGLLRLSAGIGLAAIPALAGPAAASPALAGPRFGRAAAGPTVPGPIVKPLPPELFTVFGSNAEMRWEAMRGQGYLTPTDRFFVRDHTATPLVDVDTWRLKLFGTGLRGSPRIDNPVQFTYQDILDLPAHTITAFLECAGNGRGFFGTQQNQTVPGTPWRLGAIGVARWRGVRLATLLERAGLRHSAVDILPQGLDADFISGGVNLGKVRRPLPIRKALHDTLLAYEMNGEPLPPDHGFPVRLVVPSWVGISSIKWVGQIEVSDAPLFSPFNTQLYQLFGPAYPTAGQPIDRQVVKSAFELPWNATLTRGHEHVLHGRSWSGNGPIRTVEISTDGGATWRRARPTGAASDNGWQRWLIPWRPETPGAYRLRARATDITGATQPDATTFNSLGYLFGGIVNHPVAVN